MKSGYKNTEVKMPPLPRRICYECSTCVLEVLEDLLSNEFFLDNRVLMH